MQTFDLFWEIVHVFKTGAFCLKKIDHFDFSSRSGAFDWRTAVSIR
jgi:hypothetical protein